MPDRTKEKGFTLVEIIAVLIVMGILAVIALMRMTSTTEVDNLAKAAALKSHIRYVQMKAMNNDATDNSCNASFGINKAGGKYYMFRNCDLNDKVILPGAENNEGVPLSVSASPDFPFSFDKWGAPYSNKNGTGTSASITLTITGLSDPITVTQNTGFLP